MNLPKGESYAKLTELFAAMAEGESDGVAVMANAAALLRDAFDFFWVGFYVVKNEELVLGPFQGNSACWRIKKGRGVCGTAWETGQTQLVPDVDNFPGHIACSSLSRSEIVVPLFDKRGTVCAVLDIDSDHLNAFDSTDQQGLEAFASLISELIY